MDQGEIENVGSEEEDFSNEIIPSPMMIDDQYEASRLPDPPHCNLSLGISANLYRVCH